MYRAPDGSTKKYTGMKSVFGYSTWLQDGVIINLNLKSTMSAGRERNPSMGDNSLPDMHSLSDIQWALWKNVALPRQTNVLKWYFIASIINEPTRQVIKSCVDAQPDPRNRGLNQWPGLWFPMQNIAGRAILGTSMGATLAFFLLQHKPELGNMWVAGVVVFHGNTLYRSTCLAFAVNQPGPRPRLEEEVQFRPNPGQAGGEFVGSLMPELQKGFNVSEILRKRDDAQADDAGDWIFDEQGKWVI